MFKTLPQHVILSLGIAYFCTTNSTTMSQQIPQAPVQDNVLAIHNHQRVDPYFWMNERDSKPVVDYISAENSFTEHYFKPLQPLQEILLNEFESRIDPNELSSPFVIQGRTFQYQSVEKLDYQQIIELNASPKKVLLDENERAKGKSYYDLGEWSLSPDNKLLAFSEDHTGRRKYTLFFRDEKTGKMLKDQIKDTDGSVVWANDNKTVFYIKKDPKTLREFQVFRHQLGTSTQDDQLVFQEDDERFYVQLSKLLTQQYIAIQIQSSTTSEVRLIDANKPTEKARVFIPRTSGHLYEVDHHENGFYVLSNLQAPNKKVVFYTSFPTENQVPAAIIPHHTNQLIEQVLVLKNYLVLQLRVDGLQQIQITNLTTNKQQLVSFPDETYTAQLGFNEEYNTAELYYNYTSLATPATVFKRNLADEQQSVYFQKKLIDPTFSPLNYETKRVWATANDGTKIPISIVYKKGIDLQQAPLLLYGYGSYGITIPANFSATRLSLLDRGFVYAIAHVRGGKYMGETWYENGKFQKKKNTFTDFINAAEYLGMQGYCDPAKIYAQGGSAGGLLMGAVANMAPYLWKGIIAQVPFVDVVTTMLDDSIPLTVGEYEEWGNPNEADYYWYMLSYSPYDNVHKTAYPAMYITTGYHDSQVQYWEPLKWVAKLRALKTNPQAPLLFECNMDAGHGGGSGRSVERLEVAKEFAFILNLEGIEN